MKKIAIIFAIVYLFSFSSFILPTIIPDPIPDVSVQQKNKHPAK